MSRLEKSTKNIIYSFANTIVSSLLGFISRTVFISTLGAEYLGLSGLLNNVLGFLTISELGISTIIGFSLYKPLAQKDYKTVSALMSVYRKAYLAIGIFVLVSGLGLFWFLDFFIPVDQQPPGTDFAYFAFLAHTAIGYFFSYKTTLIASDNQRFRIVPIGVAGEIVTVVTQIVVLLITKSYILYISAQIICSTASMIIQNRIITRLYKNVDFYSKEKLAPEQKKTIQKNIGALLIGKVGDYLVNSTDNLIITKMVSLAATGIYSNYLLIRNLINGYIATLYSGMTASLGNIVAIETDQKKLDIFEALLYCSFFIYSFEAVCLFCLYNTFIGDVWIGKEFLFGAPTVAIIVLNNYLTGLRIPLITIKGVAGTYTEEVWLPFAFAAINLVASIFLAKYFGIAGVFLGTIIGSVLTADWYRPIVIYRKVFHTPVIKYFKKYIVYLLLGVGYMALGYWVCSYIHTPIAILTFFCKAIIAAAIPLSLNCLLFHRTKEFAVAKGLLRRLITGIRNKIAGHMKKGQ